MAPEKSNDEGKIPTFNPQLQNPEESGFQSSNEAVGSTGITGVGTVPLMGNNWMMDGSQPGSYQNFMSQPNPMNRMIGYVPSQYVNFPNIATNTGGLQTGMQGANEGWYYPQSIGNSMSSGSRAAWPWGTQDSRGLGSDNNLRDSVVQSDHPERLDGTFLTLGSGANTESRSEANASSNFSSSSLQMLPMPQRHVSDPILTPQDQRFFYDAPTTLDPFDGLSGVSSNMRHISNQSGLPLNQSPLCLSGVSPTMHGSSQSGLPPHGGYRSPYGVSPIVHNSTHSGLPVQAQQRMAAWLRNSGSIPSSRWDASVASPALGLFHSTSNQYQSDQFFAGDGGASQVSSTVPPSNNFGVQTAAYLVKFDCISFANKLSSSDGTAAEVISTSPSFKNVGVQPSITGQETSFPRESKPANLPARRSIKRNADQPPPATPGLQRNQKISRKHSIGSSTLHRARDAPSSAPLPPALVQAAPVPSLAQSTSSVPPVKLTANPRPSLVYRGPLSSLRQASPANLQLTQTGRALSSSRMSSPDRIRWRDPEQRHEPSGMNCSICNRDLAYAPEGTLSLPDIRPSVAVMSCNHYFHDLCFQNNTPEDQANDPPCILCTP